MPDREMTLAEADAYRDAYRAGAEAMREAAAQHHDRWAASWTQGAAAIKAAGGHATEARREAVRHFEAANAIRHTPLPEPPR